MLMVYLQGNRIIIIIIIHNNNTVKGHAICFTEKGKNIYPTIKVNLTLTTR